MAGKTNGQAVASGHGTGFSKKDFVRQAIRDLGRDAKPLQIQAHIKGKFGVEMTPNHISASKTEVLREMSGAKATAAPAPAKPAATAKPAAATPATKPATPTQAAQRTVAPKPAAKKPTSPKTQATPAIAASGAGATAGSVALADVQAVKTLLARVKADDLKTLIDLLAR